jgi:hypothetical protein
MHIFPEESQIIGAATTGFAWFSDDAIVAQAPFCAPDDCASAADPHSRTKPVANTPQSPFELCILLTPPPESYSKWAAAVVNYPCGVRGDFFG